MKKQLLTLSLVSLLSACAHPEVAFVSPGQPESLLNMASDQVSLSVQSPEQLGALVKRVEKQQPSKAILQCNPAVNPSCQQALEILQLYGVNYQVVSDNHDAVVLVYKRISAKPCDNRFVSNHYNFLNENHPAFGCSVATNMVQEVSDRTQFTDPDILDLPDAESAVKAYKNR